MFAWKHLRAGLKEKADFVVRFRLIQPETEKIIFFPAR
jgi:hypothetical protein